MPLKVFKENSFPMAVQRRPGVGFRWPSLLSLGLACVSSAALIPLPAVAQVSRRWVQVDQPDQRPGWTLTDRQEPSDPTWIEASVDSPAEAGSSPESIQSPSPAPGQKAVAVAATTPPPAPFMDVGVGARIGLGEPTYPAVSLRLGVPLSNNTSLSLRPFYVFGNSDVDGVPNGQGEFTLPLTLDLFTDKPVSVYFGPGFTWNADSSGVTNFSLSGGLDFKLSNRLRLTTGLYYDMDYDKSGFGDWMANTFLHFRL